MTNDELVKHMTERFLAWKLPTNFNPDNGISVQRPNYGPNVAWEPTGTNLFDYTQAEAMVRHMLEGTLASAPPASDEVERAVMVCPQCEGEGGYADGFDEAACHTECTRCGGNGWIADLSARAALAALSRPADAGLREALIEECAVRGEEAVNDARNGDVDTDLRSVRYHVGKRIRALGSQP